MDLLTEKEKKGVTLLAIILCLLLTLFLLNKEVELQHKHIVKDIGGNTIEITYEPDTFNK